MSRWHVRTSDSKAKEFIKSAKAKLRAAVWGCEQLETRLLFQTVTWITQGNGNWSVGTNWSTGAAPQAGDDVVIYTPGVDSVITYNAAATLALGNLTCDEELDLGGAGGETWTGGTIQGSGIIENDSTLAISGSADKYLENGIELDNESGATITVSGSGNIVGEVGATINNLNGMAGPAIFNVESDMEITFPTGIGDGVFNNDGTFEKTAGGTAAGDMTEIGGAQGFTFNNDGLCQILQGTLGLGDNANTSVSTAGIFQISSGATLEYLRGNEDIPYLATGASPPYIFPSITGAGTLLMTGGNVQLYGVFDVNTLDMESGSLLLQQNMTAEAGTPQLITGLSAPTAGGQPLFCPAGNVNNFIMNGGTFGGNGGGIFGLGQPTTFNTMATPPTNPGGPFVTSSQLPIFTLNPGTYELPALIVGGTFSWTSGTIGALPGETATGRIVLDSTITSATITTTDPKAITGGFGLDMLLPVIWTGSGTIGLTGGSGIVIEPTGEFWDQDNGTVSGEGSTGYIINEGNFLKEDGTGTTLIDAGITFYNNTAGEPGLFAPLLYQVGVSPLVAQLDIQTGTLAFNGNSTNTDDYTIAAGATLSFLAGTQINGTTSNNLNVTAKILGVDFEGTINFGDCTFTGDNEARLDVGTTNFGDGTYEFNNVAGGAQVIHVGTFTGDETGTIGGNGTIEVAGTFQWNSGTFTGTGSGTSSLLIDAGATLAMTAGSYQTTNDYSVDNEGTIQWTTSPGTLSINGDFNQAGTGTFDCEIVQGVPDSLTVSGTITLLTGATFNLTTDGFTPTAGETYTIIDNTGGAPISGIFVGLPEGTVFNVGTDTFVVTYLGGAAADSMVLTSIVKPVITILTPNVLVRPLSGTTLMNFTVELSAASNEVVTVNYATSPGTAVAGVDYDSTSGTLTFPAGTTQETITVTIIGTSAVEAPVTFTVSLSDPTLSTLGTPSSAVGTVASLNGPPVLSFSSSAYVVDEDAGFATVIVVSSDSSIPSTVSYQTVDGTAVAGVDYTATSGVLVFAKGTSQVSFNVPIINLGLESGQRTFSIVLSNPTGLGASIGLGTTVVGILENATPTPSMTIGNATVTELVNGQTPAVFTVTLSAAYTGPVSVQYATASGTAVEGKYVAQSGTLTLQPGQTTATISIEVNSDFVQSTTETFSVNLSDPVNVTLANTTGIGTILSQTLTTLQISAGHPFRYLDGAGHHTTISMAGPGVGTITYLGPTTVDGKEIVLNGTTAATRLSISSNGGAAHIVNIIVNGSLGAINAPTTDLQGDVTVTGSLATLHMASLLGGNTVSIGAGTGVLNAAFANVTDTTLTSGVPLGTVHVTSWLDATSGGGITAPSARSISAAGVFNSSVALSGNLGALSVHGGLNNSTIRVGGNIGTVTARTMLDSDIFAGVLSSVTTLPTATSAFADSSSTIKSLTVTSHALDAYTASIIAAPIVGNVQLSAVNPNNGGTPFGVAGSSIHLAQARITKAVKLTDTSLTTSPFSDADLEIRLVT